MLLQIIEYNKKDMKPIIHLWKVNYTYRVQTEYYNYRLEIIHKYLFQRNLLFNLYFFFKKMNCIPFHITE